LEGALSGFGPALYVEYALLAMLFGLVASHGACFGRRLVELAEAPKEAGFRKGPSAGSQAEEIAEALLLDLHAEHPDQCSGHDLCLLRPGRVSFPTPPCKVSPDTVGREVELSGELLDHAAGTPRQPSIYNKQNIYLIYC
jgi:hypothetical protein